MQSPIMTIMTNDLERSIKFYKDVLEFKQDCLKKFPSVTLVFLHREHFCLELVARNKNDPLTPGNTCILTFICNSFKEIKERLDKHDIRDAKEIILPSGVEMLRFQDPNGVTISFVIDPSDSKD